MTFLKRIGIFLVNFIFRFSLFIGLTLLATVLILANSNTPKNILKEVDAHNRFTESIIDSSIKNQQNNINSIPLEDSEVKNAIKNALNEKSLTKISDQVIDSTYAWLNGDTSDIEFSIDLSENKQALASAISAYAVNRIASLEPCTSPPAETNVFKLECNPTGVDLNQLQVQIKSDILNDKAILTNEKLTIDNLPKTDTGQKITEAYDQAPKYFQLFKIAPFFFIGLALICSILVVYSSRTKRSGYKKVGSTIFATAIIMAVSPLIYIYILPLLGLKAPSFGGNDESVASIVNDATTQLYSGFNIMLLNVALQTAVVGLVILMATKFLKSSTSVYFDVEKKAGLSISEAKPKNSTNAVDMSTIPIQTSEVPKKKTKKGKELSKKYKKL